MELGGTARLWLAVVAMSASASSCAATQHRSVDAGHRESPTKIPFTSSSSEKAASQASTTTPSTFATTTTSRQPPQAWASTERCDGPGERPAYIDVYFAYKSRPSWSYSEALSALKRHGLDTGVLERNGDTLWKEHAQVPGTVGTLLGRAQGLAGDTRGADGYPPMVTILCAGLVSLVDDFTLEHDPGVTTQTLIARNGHQETQRGEERASYLGNSLFVTVATTDPRSVIERVIAWLADPAVYGAQANRSCIRPGGFVDGQPPPPPTPGCDTRVS